eukprot:848084-Rhodomonas_salina.1
MVQALRTVLSGGMRCTNGIWRYAMSGTDIAHGATRHDQNEERAWQCSAGASARGGRRGGRGIAERRSEVEGRCEGEGERERGRGRGRGAEGGREGGGQGRECGVEGSASAQRPRGESLYCC